MQQEADAAEDEGTAAAPRVPDAPDHVVTAEGGAEGPRKGSPPDGGLVLVLGAAAAAAPPPPLPHLASPFAYSQENFHIADGNLFSILTPQPPRAATAAPAPAQPPLSSVAPRPASSTLPDDNASAPQRTRARRRPAKWKLKFHHQALPPEYLDHYEAAMAQEARAVAAASGGPPPAAGGEGPGPSRARAGAKGPRRVPAFIHDLQQVKGAKDKASASANQRPTEEDGVTEGRTASVIRSSGPHQQQQGGPPASPLRDSLPFMGEMRLDGSRPRRGRKPKKADICHLIYKNYGTVVRGADGGGGGSPSSSSPSTPPSASPRSAPESSLLARRLMTPPGANKRLPPPQPDPLQQDEPLNLCIRDLGRIRVKVEPPEEEEGGPSPLADPRAAPPTPASYIYWPHAGLLVHPMTLQPPLLYCHKAGGPDAGTGAAPEGAGAAPEGWAPPNPALAPADSPAPPPAPTPPAARKRGAAIHAPGAVPAAAATSTTTTTTKRRRSAIFIPPSADNPTEVSICKFKFTGGAKPSLEEKKMLSVDAGGNFRYYSGTGDKAMRGYEFFPRPEQPSAGPGPSAKAPPCDGPSSSRAPPEGGSAAAAAEPSPKAPGPGPTARRKRRTRKSLVREKLEQTFREKGFLIQTQQLESAEGATYCKFRQLRKFTRYLFRSWKDYLPGNIKEISGAVGGGEASEAAAAAEEAVAAAAAGVEPRPPHE